MCLDIDGWRIIRSDTDADRLIDMLIQIELRDKDHKGNRFPNKVVMTYCRVIGQAGDGLRLNNIAIPVQKFYHAMTVALLSKDPEHPEVDKIDKGSMMVINNNLERFLSEPDMDD